MTRYRITSRSGADHGTYSGATPAEALLAMHRDAGYGPDVVWLDEDSDPVFCDDQMRYALGGVTDWHIEPIEEAP